ncbi:hypothetical protein WJX74_008029 [Apatococcus lobatus]|uniref:Prenyltransferase alpha-alpha toroid domain-containing protein n=1 Tax=Apatococcus lobatus TaxID=904363 RepID=A0AAW1QLL1_9CHLO
MPVTPETVVSQQKLEAKVETFFSKFAEFDTSDQQDSLELLRRLHIRYVQGGLGSLPSGYSSLDSGRPWICYWILHSLALLDGPLPASISAQDVTAFLNLCQADTGGYGGSPGQLPHLAPSYAAVAALISLGDQAALSSIQRDSMHSFLQSRCMGVKHGGGFAVCEGGEVDVRGCYTALAIASMLQLDAARLARSADAVSFVVRCQTFEGGLGGEPGNEAHGGYTYCGLAALMLIDCADALNLPHLLHWAVHCQGSVEGGFAGRTHKLVDGCYSFWQGALFPLLRRLQPLISHQQGLPLQMPPVSGDPSPRHSSASMQKSDPDTTRLNPAESPEGAASEPNMATGSSQHALPASELCSNDLEAFSRLCQGSDAASHRLTQLNEACEEQQPAHNETASGADEGRVGGTGSAGHQADSAADEVWLPDIPEMELQTPEQQATARLTAAQAAAESAYQQIVSAREAATSAKSTGSVNQEQNATCTSSPEDAQANTSDGPSLAGPSAGIAGKFTSCIGPGPSSTSSIDPPAGAQSPSATSSGTCWGTTAEPCQCHGQHVSPQTHTRVAQPLWYNPGALQLWILLCCQVSKGGLRDKPGKPADYYHTCYCLSGLSASQHSSGLVLGPQRNLLKETDLLCNADNTDSPAASGAAEDTQPAKKAKRNHKPVTAGTEIGAAGLAKTAGTAKKLATAAAAGFLHTALSIVLLMVLNNIANSKFAAILGWAAWHGVQGIATDKKYNQIRYFRKFLAVCSEWLLRQQLKQIAASPYCAVLLDNSTNKSLDEHCLLYVRYLDLKAMKANTEYLCTVKLFSKTVLSLFETLKLVLGIVGIDVSKVTAMCTDGDAAMTGRENGLRGGYFKEEVKQFMQDLVQDVKGGLQERFPDADVLNRFRIFDPKSYEPVGLGQPLVVFGKTELLRILNHVAKSTVSHKLLNLTREQQQQLLTVEFPAMKQALWRKSREMSGLQA